MMELLVDVNKAANNGWTPLHIAAHWGYIDIMKCLFYYAALLDVKNSDGEVPVDVSLDDDVREAFNVEEKRRRDHGFKRALPDVPRSAAAVEAEVEAEEEEDESSGSSSEEEEEDD